MGSRSENLGSVCTGALGGGGAAAGGAVVSGAYWRSCARRSLDTGQTG